jgi:hypothetical protein
VLFPEHDGVPVAALVDALLVPRLTALENALEGARWESVRSERWFVSEWPAYWQQLGSDSWLKL